MRLVFAGGGGRETIDPVGISVFVRQATFSQPIEHAVEGHAVDRQGAQGGLNLVMRQRSRRGAQQAQNADARRCRARTGAANLLGDSIDAGEMRRRQGEYPAGKLIRRLDHSAKPDATLLQ